MFGGNSITNPHKPSQMPSFVSMLSAATSQSNSLFSVEEGVTSDDSEDHHNTDERPSFVDLSAFRKIFQSDKLRFEGSITKNADDLLESNGCVS